MTWTNAKTNRAAVARFTVRSVYGELKIYPNCDNARAFCDLAGKKTLHARDLLTIQDRLDFIIMLDGATLECQKIGDLMTAARDFARGVSSARRGASA